MIRSIAVRLLGFLPVLTLLAAQSGLGQGYDGPLTIQGLDRSTFHSAAARAMGGVTIGLRNDVGVMFRNPASLSSLQGLQVSLGGLRRSSTMEQVQHYAPVRYYSNFSLLMEGLTDRIPDPDPLLGGSGPRDTVQRPHDDIGPNWSRSNSRTVPLHGLLALPVSLADVRIVAGMGAVEYADVNHYYQNNNVLVPPVFLQRPLPALRPTDDSPVSVDWLQYVRSRDGSIRGYGAAISAGFPEHGFSVGVSGMLLRGSSDDYERHLARGRLTFFSNAFRLDSTYGRVTVEGRSEYRGEEFTLSGIYRGQNVGIGITVRPPMTIRRSYTLRVETDTTGLPARSTVSGGDELRFPWRSTLALLLLPRENLTLAAEYEIRPYASALYRTNDGSESSPWISSSVLRIGVEYSPYSWLVVRGGIRGEAEVFEPEGNPIPGEPVKHSVYSVGVGFLSGGLRLNIAYEYSTMKYEGVWGSAVVMHRDRRSTLIADLMYAVPRFW